MEECEEDLDACDAEVQECNEQLRESERFPGTGQRRRVVAGEDGNPAFGAPLNYSATDLTVFDFNTRLEWEKKTTDGGLNNVDDTYPWRGFCNVAGDGGGSDAECGTDADYTWLVLFLDGGVGDGGKTGDSFVRAVRSPDPRRSSSSSAVRVCRCVTWR
jgi:hypothetical protein